MSKIRIPVTKPSLPPLAKLMKELQKIWKTRMLSNFGIYAKRFESNVCKYLRVKKTLAVVNCDIGLVLSLASLELPHGSECIIPSYTFNSGINAVLWNGLVPVFCDIDADTLCADPDSIERAITDKTKVILCTHTFGNPCDADKIRGIAKKHNLYLLFDAAHAYGSAYKDVRVGGLGDLEVFSFSGTKVITSAEGGIVTGRRTDLMDKIEYMRGYGFMGDYISRYVGVNAKMSEIHAALAVLNIGEVERMVRRRNKIVRIYRDALGCIDGVKFQKVEGGNISTYKDFAVMFEAGRDILAENLASKGIQVKKYFHPLHLMQRFAKYRRGNLPITEDVYSKVLCLPIYNDITDREVMYISGAVKRFYKM